MMAQTTAERAGERAKTRAENRANNRVDRSVDKAVDDAFNAVGNLFKKKKKKKDTGAKSDEPTSTGNQSRPEDSSSSNGNDTGAAGALGGIMGGNSGPWEPYTNPHSFSLRMEITETKKNGRVQQHAMDMGVTSNRFAIRIEDEDQREMNRMILNTEDGKTTMITTDKKGQQTGFRMRMPGMRKAMAEATEDMHDRFTFTATGERRTIDGYDCEKVIVEDTKEGTTTTSWVTQDLNMEAQDIFSSMMGLFGTGQQRNNGATSSLSGAYSGFPILSTSNDGKSTYETRFKNIKVGEGNVDRSLLSTTGIQIQELGF